MPANPTIFSTPLRLVRIFYRKMKIFYFNSDKFKFLLSLCLIFLQSGSCTNILSQSAFITDDSLLVSAQISMNAKNYTAALTSFNLMSATYLAQRNIVALKAAAYAGRCGLDFIGLVNSFSSIGSSTVLSVLYKSAISSSASKETDCTSAEALLLSIAATSAGRTVAENLLLGLIEFQRIGSVLGQYADQGGKGTVDVGFNPCLTTKGTIPAVTGLPVIEAQNLSASLMIGFDSLSASGINAFSGSASSFQTYCTTIAALTGTNPCAKTAPSSFTNPELAILMGLVKTNFFGIGSCADTTLATCLCLVYP